jgi:carbon-monoxide dehydrogenase large subunit
MTVHCPARCPPAVRGGLADAIPGLTPERARAVGDVGGGFGMKTGIYPEDVAVAWAARAHRPAGEVAGRALEDFLSAVHGRDVTSAAELALDADGKVLALRVQVAGQRGRLRPPPRGGDPAADRPLGATSIYDIRPSTSSSPPC